MKSKIKSFIAVSMSLAVVVLSGCGAGGPREAKKIDPPTKQECLNYNLEGVHQTDEISNEDTDYVLTDYIIEPNYVEYEFTEKKTSNGIVTVTVSKQTRQEFEASMPDVELQDIDIDGMACKFLNRTVHYVPDGYELDEQTMKNVEKGTTEIRYGSDSDIEQLVPVQRVYWYDDEGQMGYTLDIMEQYYDADKLAEYVREYLKKSK